MKKIKKIDPHEAQSIFSFLCLCVGTCATCYSCICTGLTEASLTAFNAVKTVLSYEVVFGGQSAKYT